MQLMSFYVIGQAKERLDLIFPWTDFWTGFRHHA
jgi:hypothetical protein